MNQHWPITALILTLISKFRIEMAIPYVDDVSLFAPVDTLKLPDDFHKRSE